MARMLQWKKDLKAVMDNPDYIELQISAIQKELQKELPDTGYLREKVGHIDKWLGEIDLSRRRRLKKVI